MSKRILVVEDQPDNRQIIRDMLANLQTARVLGIDVPSGLLSIADEVIE
jgi:CheY-like chemotaxis protein